jgi:hypothetical protein
MRVRISATEQGGGLTRAASLCAAFAACVALPALAGEPPASEPVQAAAEAEVAPNVGMRVAIDAATGRPRALTAKEAAELDALTAKSRATARAPAVRTFTARGGAIGADLDPSYMVYSVATVGADGKPRMECVTGADHADAAVHDHAHADGHDHQETGHETR